MFIMVDLNNTFFKINIHWFLFKHVLHHDFFFALQLIVYWFIYGPAKVKHLLSPYLNLFNLDVFVNKKLLKFLELQKNVTIVLATGSSYSIGSQVVLKFGVFSDCITSTEDFNCVREEKLKKILSFTEEEPFFYIGHSINDLPIWESAKKIGVVNPTEELLNKIKSMNKDFVVFYD